MVTTISISPGLKKKLEVMKGNLGWEDFLDDLVNFGKSGKEKHIALDRALRDINIERRDMKAALDDVKLRFKDEVRAEVERRGIEYEKMKQELDHLREILRLR